MYFEDFTHGIGVAYYSPEASKTPAQWAEVFGRKCLDALIANRPVEEVEDFARLAAKYARIVLEERDAEQEQRNQAHREEVQRAFDTLKGGQHLGGVRS